MEHLTPPAPSVGETPAAELSRIMTDTSHPMHAGYQRSDPNVSAYIKGLYEKRYGQTPADLGGEVTFTEEPVAPKTASPAEGQAELSPEERVAQAEVETRLRHIIGNEYDTEMRHMRIASSQLFASPESVKVLTDTFAPFITELGPQAEVLAIRFLSQLGQLHLHRRSS